MRVRVRRGASARLPDCAIDLPLRLLLLQRLALVVQLAALRDGEVDLGASALEVDLERNERAPLLLDASDQLADLLAMEEQPARSKRVDVPAAARLVGADVHVVQPDLAVVDA